MDPREQKNISENKVTQKSETVLREERILSFWKENDIFNKSLKKESPKGNFIFFEGPPTANGRPGVHHLESRAFKDALPRYKTMRGYRVPRKAGWDTHGLPVELEVEKELLFSGKKDIEAYGIGAFNKKCRESVFKYVNEWQKFTERIGYWVDQEKAYFTFNPSYMESAWNIFKHISDEGRLYKDYKILPWCSRCGTALSSHELAQGYEEVKDLSVTVKFELIDEPGTYFLAWTTTPWTLPGNVALAVGKDIEYVKVAREGEKYWVAKDLLTKVFQLEGEATLIPEASVLGQELIGKKYKPLYTYAQALASESEKAKFDKAFQVYSADFVTTDDGTGIVHTAVMYGQDDFELGTKIDLPKVHLVNPTGRFIEGTDFLTGRFVKEIDANGKPTLAVEIIDDLKKRGLFFSQENYKHTYPFCWRCKTPLIYYARDSWFIRMSDLRPKLIEENKKVNWIPSHIRDGRMGEWLSGDKDWSISRERYWGTPLPVWRSEDSSEQIVIGSIEELKKHTKKSGNTYFIMRHGEGQHNVDGVTSSDKEGIYPLTEKGRIQAKNGGALLQDKKITKIFSSPVRRARETAQIVAEELGIPLDSILYDNRLREIEFGDFEGGPYENFTTHKHDYLKNYEDALPGGESWLDVKKRFGSFLYEIEKVCIDENILVVTHGAGLETLPAVARASTNKESKKILDDSILLYATPEKLPFIPLPHNENYELDLHRPYIDDIELVSESGTSLYRVNEVMDVWFDSGAMPFAQDHYPFENKKGVDEGGYPADFISEAIDQTRGWFYTLLAVGVLLGKGAPYKNVMCLGHLLDEKGQKMSKSKGNGINPWEAIERYGVDTLRLWMYSVNQPGDSKIYDDKTVKESARVISWFENSAKFYELFTHGDSRTTPKDSESNVLDSWMRARIDETIKEATKAFDAYDLYGASRSVAGVIEDLSQWYVRRVRDRVRDGDTEALYTLRYTLKTIALLSAPLTPFIAEDIYQKVRTEGDPQSVHLADWPEVVDETSVFKKLFSKTDTTTDPVIEEMKKVRTCASKALMLRQKANIKVRQPLLKLFIPGDMEKEFRDILCEEVNVKDVVTGSAITEIELDTTLTPALIKEGQVREIIRAISEARKEWNLSPKDLIALMFSEHARNLLEGEKIQGVREVAFDLIPKDTAHRVSLEGLDPIFFDKR
jgi:isoleucyl-tRNA synthetase